MPTTTRQSTPAAAAPVPRQPAKPAPEETPAAESAVAPEPAPEVTPAAEHPDGAQPAPQGGRPPGAGLVDAMTFPLRVSRGLVRDVTVTARNPEAVAYWGGLAALAVLGALEWPVAAAAGLGVVVAGAVRRGRA